jgi:hypothetical protein
VSNYSATDAKLKARTQPRDIEVPKPYGSGGIPLSGVREGHSVSIDEGRPVENAIEQLADEAPDVQNQIDQIRTGAAAKDAATDLGYSKQISGMDAQRAAQIERAKIARKERDDAERQMALVQRELKANDQSYDPDRVVKNMSTGSRIGMIILATLNGAFSAMAGKTNNGVIDALDLEITRDIDRQKTEVANRKATLNNDYKRFLDMGFDAKQAEALARDKAEAAIFALKDLEAKRVGAQGEYARQAEQLIAPIRVAWSQRRGDVMKETEAKVKRTQDVSRANEVPQAAVMTPQDALALFNLTDKKVEQANAQQVAEAVGHPVTADEANQIKTDAKDYGKRAAVIASTRKNLQRVATLLKLKDAKGRFTGEADSGWWGTAEREAIDDAFSLLQRADVMSMTREPSAALQDRFGKNTQRKFFDSRALTQLNQLAAVLDDAQAELQAGYGNEVVSFYSRQAAGSSRTKTQPGAPAAPKPGTTPAQRAAAEAERKKTEAMMRAPGDMVVE